MNYTEDTTQLQQSIAVRFASPSKCGYSLTAAAVLFVALAGFAQETTPAEPPAMQNQPQQPAPTAMIVLPAGTQIPLALQRAISTKTSRPGDMVYLLTTAPVVLGDRVVIPPDTFVQGQIAKITIEGVNRDGELRIRSPRIVFASGYAVAIPYDLVVPLDRQWIYPEAPGAGKALGLTAAFAAPVAGALIGGLASQHNPPPLTPPVIGQPLTVPNLGNPVKGAAIGAAAGFAVAIPVAIALLRHHHDFFVEGGVPSEMILEEPLVLEEDRIAAGVFPRGSLAATLPARSLAPKTCYTPDTPATAATVVPGTPAIPGTPPVGDMPGTPGIPGTPDTIIPGSPAIPGTAYPCP